jgi:hypothetical protein
MKVPNWMAKCICNGISSSKSTISLGTDDELMKPVDEMVFISAIAAARFDCDWENIFMIQAKQTTKAAGL